MNDEHAEYVRGGAVMQPSRALAKAGLAFKSKSWNARGFLHEYCLN